MTVRIGDYETQLRRTRRRIDAIVHEIHRRLVRVAVFARKADPADDLICAGRTAGRRADTRTHEVKCARLVDVDVDVKGIHRHQGCKWRSRRRPPPLPAAAHPPPPPPLPRPPPDSLPTL